MAMIAALENGIAHLEGWLWRWRDWWWNGCQLGHSLSQSQFQL
jgi:hypothetical protein